MVPARGDVAAVGTKGKTIHRVRRKWKKPRTRMRKLIALGLDWGRARESAFNGRGPWWSAGASHMNAALPTAYFRRMGLISLLDEVLWFTTLREQRSL